MISAFKFSVTATLTAGDNTTCIIYVLVVIYRLWYGYCEMQQVVLSVKWCISKYFCNHFTIYIYYIYTIIFNVEHTFVYKH